MYKRAILSLALLLGGYDATASVVMDPSSTEGPVVLPEEVAATCADLVASLQASAALSLKKAGKDGGDVTTSPTWAYTPFSHRVLMASCVAYVLTGSTEAPPAPCASSMKTAARRWRCWTRPATATSRPEPAHRRI